MCTYLKNMGGYKHNHLKGRSYEEIHKLFDKAYKQLESDKSKKQKIDKHVEAEKDDQEEAEMKRNIEIVKDDKVAIVIAAQLQLLNGYYYWKEYTDRDEIKD
ncbi:hypothetical protein Tco_0151958 [Tanacetum coccineum]